MTQGRSIAPTATGEIREPDWRRLYVLQHPLAVTMAVAAVVGSVVCLAFPGLFEQSTVTRSLPGHLAHAWIALYGAGGVLALLGYWRLSSRFEVPGLILQSTCYLTYALAGAPIIAVVVTLALAIGMGTRAFVIFTRPEVQPWTSRR